jgi:microcystin-dependent protein
MFRVGDMKPVAVQVTDNTLEQALPADPSWLVCNGAAVSRAKYAGLFAELGTAFGAGDGSTTFNLPNLKGRGLFGQKATGALVTRGASGGAKTHTLSQAEMPSHTETAGYYNADSGHGNAGSAPNTSGGGSGVTSGSAGGGSAHNNLSPYLTVGCFAVKAL